MELDFSQTAYGKWENDQFKPGFDNLLKISEFYETDIYDLLREKGYVQVNNNNESTNDNGSGVIQNQTINNNASEKLTEQYQKRIKELKERNHELKEQIEWWKSRAGDGRS